MNNHAPSSSSESYDGDPRDTQSRSPARGNPESLLSRRDNGSTPQGGNALGYTLGVSGPATHEINSVDRQAAAPANWTAPSNLTSPPFESLPTVAPGFSLLSQLSLPQQQLLLQQPQLGHQQIQFQNPYQQQPPNAPPIQRAHQPQFVGVQQSLQQQPQHFLPGDPQQQQNQIQQLLQSVLQQQRMPQPQGPQQAQWLQQNLQASLNLLALALPLLAAVQTNPEALNQLTAAALPALRPQNQTASQAPGHAASPSQQLFVPPHAVSQVASSQPQTGLVGQSPQTKPPGLTNRQPIPLLADSDEESLTEYQRLVRQNIEVFEATESDVQGSAQGRNIPIQLGQVGIRCRHCAKLPPSARARGSVYYTRTIVGVYQVAQNMAKVHLCNHCVQMPKDLKRKLNAMQRACNRNASGGKSYWSKVLVSQGVYEDNGILRFRPL